MAPHFELSVESNNPSFQGEWDPDRQSHRSRGSDVSSSDEMWASASTYARSRYSGYSYSTSQSSTAEYYLHGKKTIRLGLDELAPHVKSQRTMTRRDIIKAVSGFVFLLIAVTSTLYMIAEMSDGHFPSNNGTVAPAPGLLRPTYAPTRRPTLAPTQDQFIHPVRLNNLTLDLQHFYESLVPEFWFRYKEAIVTEQPGGLIAASNLVGACQQSWYSHGWVRDIAYTNNAFVSLYEREPAGEKRDQYERALMDFVEFFNVFYRNSGGGEWTNKQHILGRGEVHPAASLYENPGACAVQMDATAARVLTMLRFAKAYLAIHGSNGLSYVNANMYHSDWQNINVNSPIKRDLEYLFKNWENGSCDRWVEIDGMHFHTLQMIRRALVVGAEFTVERNDALAGEAYLRGVAAIDAKLPEFWVEAEQTYVPTIGSKYRHDDIQVLLGSTLHMQVRATGEKLSEYITDRMMKDLMKSLVFFDGSYGINQNGFKAASLFVVDDPTPPKGLGPAIGRYEGDRYGGDCNRKTGEHKACRGTECVGQAWFLATNEFASIFYRIAEMLWEEEEFQVTELTRPLFEYVGLNSVMEDYPGLWTKGTYPFSTAVQMLMYSGDSVFRRTGWHTQWNNEVHEQINVDSGVPHSVGFHIASYASIVSAWHTRQHVYEQIGGNYSALTPEDHVNVALNLDTISYRDYEDYSFVIVGETPSMGELLSGVVDICKGTPLKFRRKLRDHYEVSGIAILPRNSTIRVQAVGLPKGGTTERACQQGTVVAWPYGEELDTQHDFVQNGKAAVITEDMNPMEPLFLHWCYWCVSPVIPKPILRVTFIFIKVPADEKHKALGVEGNYKALGLNDKCNASPANFVSEDSKHRTWRLSKVELPLPASTDIMFGGVANPCDNTHDPTAVGLYETSEWSSYDMTDWIGYKGEDQDIEITHVWNCPDCKPNQDFLQITVGPDDMKALGPGFVEYVITGPIELGGFDPCNGRVMKWNKRENYWFANIACNTNNQDYDVDFKIAMRGPDPTAPDDPSKCIFEYEEGSDRRVTVVHGGLTFAARWKGL